MNDIERAKMIISFYENGKLPIKIKIMYAIDIIKKEIRRKINEHRNTRKLDRTGRD